MATPGEQGPPLPEGWQASWNYQHNQWFYFHPSTSSSQWEFPSGDPLTISPLAAPPPSHHDPAQPQGFPPGSTAGEPAPGERGIVGNAALFGGGLAAGTFLEHKIDEFKRRHQNNQGSGGLLGSVGATGALGSKLSGFFGGVPLAYTPPAYTPPAPMAAGPGPGPEYSGPGYFAAGAAVAYASTPPANQPYQGNPGGPPPGAVAGWDASYVPGSVASSGPPLIILAATFADMDVTAKVQASVTADQSLTYDCTKLKEEFGNPWPEIERKSFHILYRYGDRPLEVCVGNTEKGKIEIRNEPLSNARMDFINKKPGRIIALIWGQESVLNEERVASLDTAGELDCSDLGQGGFWPWEPRALIVYYKTPEGGITIGHGREGGTLRLPWNPLAKWS